MLLYQGTSQNFIRDAADGRLTDRIEMAFFGRYHYAPEERGFQTFGRYLRSLAKVMDAAGVQDSGVILKYQLPATSRRLDCMVTGRDDEGREHVVIIEMKDWQECCLAEGGCELIDERNGLPIEILHPSVQSMQYRAYLQGSNRVFQDDQLKLSTCTFLPEYEMKAGDTLLDDRFRTYLDASPVFSYNEKQALGQFLQKRLHRGEGTSIAHKLLDDSKVVDQQLIQQAAGVLGGTKTYALLDEQKVAYDKIMAAVKASLADGNKQTIIVRGGPGTGKSVIALNLLADLRNKLHIDAQYATGSRAYHETLTKILGTRSKEYIRYFNSYTNAGWSSVPVIICDEAHRIRKTSNNRFVSVAQRLHKPQVDELLDAGQVCIFLLDDHQNIRPDEIGSTDYIRSHAQRKGCPTWELTLQAQFRCRGAESYINWLDHTLGIRRTQNVLWDATSEEFDFRICESPQQMEELLRAQMEKGHSARIAADFAGRGRKRWMRTAGWNGM